MTYQAERVEGNTQRKAGRPQKFDHAANQRLLSERFRYISPDTRALILNIIEANSRHWYRLAGGTTADFEQLFNQEKHGEQ